MAFLAKICFKKSITKNFFYPKLSYTLCWQSKSLSLICVCTNKLLIKLIMQHACLLGDRKLLILSTTLLRFTFFVIPDIGLRPFIVYTSTSSPHTQYQSVVDVKVLFPQSTSKSSQEIGLLFPLWHINLLTWNC